MVGCATARPLTSNRFATGSDGRASFSLSSPRHVFHQANSECRPASLVRRAQAPACFTVEIFVEQNQIAPMWIVGPARVATMTGTVPAGVRQEKASKPAAQLACHFLQVHEPA